MLAPNGSPAPEPEPVSQASQQTIALPAQRSAPPAIATGQPAIAEATEAAR